MIKERDDRITGPFPYRGQIGALFGHPPLRIDAGAHHERRTAPGAPGSQRPGQQLRTAPHAPRPAEGEHRRGDLATGQLAGTGRHPSAPSWNGNHGSGPNPFRNAGGRPAPTPCDAGAGSRPPPGTAAGARAPRQLPGTAVRALRAARSSARTARIHAVRRAGDQGTPGGGIRP